MGPLWEATRDVHHRAEQHPVAKRMIDGSITAPEWADWLHALWRIHTAIDPHLPSCVRRAHAVAYDLLTMLPVEPQASKAVDTYVSSLETIPDIFGAAYITVGAHRRGGRVVETAMQKAGVDLPHSHIVFGEPQQVEMLITRWREMPELEHGARRAFVVLFDVMEEIEGRHA